MNDKTHEPTTTLVADALNNLSRLVREEFNLARAEIDANLRRAMTAVGFIVAAVVFALTALNVLAAAISAGLVALGLDAGWSALIVGVAFGVLAWAMMSKGLNDLKLSSLAPTRTTENVKRDARAVKGGINGQ